MAVSPRNLPLSEIEALCRKHQVAELALFGSVVEDRATAQSDLDFLVTFEPEARIGFLALARLSRELSEVTRRRVDLVPRAGLKDSIREEVLRSREVLFEAR